MLPAHPPRRISRSSTRKETESLSSWSTTRESANLPPNVIRWSVAMEPAIRSVMGTSGQPRPGTAGWTDPRWCEHYRSVLLRLPRGSPYGRAMGYERLAYDDQ